MKHVYIINIYRIIKQNQSAYQVPLLLSRQQNWQQESMMDKFLYLLYPKNENMFITGIILILSSIILAQDTEENKVSQGNLGRL